MSDLRVRPQPRGHTDDQAGGQPAEPLAFLRDADRLVQRFVLAEILKAPPSLRRGRRRPRSWTR